MTLNNLLVFFRKLRVDALNIRYLEKEHFYLPHNLNPENSHHAMLLVAGWQAKMQFTDLFFCVNQGGPFIHVLVSVHLGTLTTGIECKFELSFAPLFVIIPVCLPF